MHRFFNPHNLAWTCHHLHLDKARTVSPDLLHQANAHMKGKWYLMRDIKRQYIYDDLKLRMLQTANSVANQGCTKMRTFVDVDKIVGLDPLYAALEVKQELKQKNIELQIGTQPLEGLACQRNIDMFMTAADMCDFIGCLPSRDPSPEHHLDIVFATAKNLNKDVEAHLDQCNVPSERETELFCNAVEQHNYEGRARAIHCVSLAAQPVEYQHKIAQRLHDLDIGVIVCPSAAISMTQHSEVHTPTHNSIAPVSLLLQHHVKVGLGIDNIEDIFMPMCDGDLEFELRLLAEACRLYDTEKLVAIAENGMGFASEK